MSAYQAFKLIMSNHGNNDPDGPSWKATAVVMGVALVVVGVILLIVYFA